MQIAICVKLVILKLKGEKMRKILGVMAVIGSTILFQGCGGGMTPQLKSNITSLSSSSVVCSNECTLEWDRAEFWINKHSKLKIQTITKNTIVTYNPYKGKQFGFSLTKEPLGGGKYRISTNVNSYLSIGEDVSTEEVKKMLNHYIRTGEDLAVGMGGLLSSIR